MAEYGQTMANEDGSPFVFQYPPETDYPAQTNLREVFAAVRDVTDYALQTKQQFNAIANASEQSSFDRFMTQLGMSTRKTVAEAQAEVIKAEARNKVAQAQNPNPIYQAVSGADTLNKLAAIASIVGVLYMFAKGK